MPEKAGLVDYFVVDSGKFGPWTQYLNGVDVTLNIQAWKGLTLVGGTSPGQTVANNCRVRANLPELSTSVTGTSAFGAGLWGAVVIRATRNVTWRLASSRKRAASPRIYVPKAAVVVSAIVQSKPGPMLAANYAAPDAIIAPRTQGEVCRATRPT